MFQKKKINPPTSNVQGTVAQGAVAAASIPVLVKAIAKKKVKLSDSQIKELVEKAKGKAKEITGQSIQAPSYSPAQWEAIMRNFTVASYFVRYNSVEKKYELNVLCESMAKSYHLPEDFNITTEKFEEISGLIKFLENQEYTTIYDVIDHEFKFVYDPEKAYFNFTKNWLSSLN